MYDFIIDLDAYFCEKYAGYDKLSVLPGYKMPLMQVENFLDVITFPEPKCLIVGDPEILKDLELEMREKLQHCMSVYRSEPFFLELLPLGIDKAKCLDKCFILDRKSGQC